MTHRPISVLVVDDQVHFPRAARTVLGVTDDFEVVAEATSVQDALRTLDERAIELVLMDVNMVPMNGIEGARAVLARPDPPVVVLCSTHRREQLPRIPEDLDVSFLDKEDLDPERLLAAWNHHRPR